MKKWLQIIKFWFCKKPDYNKWFKSKKKYDKYIKNNFINTLKSAENGDLFHWIYQKDSFLALIILLDQFSRHIYRGTINAYKNDNMAINIVKLCINKYINKLDVYEKIFILLPFQHSENISDQYYGIKLLKNMILNETSSKKYVLEDLFYHQKKHCELIEKFNRFPKRNKIYGIKSTKDEKIYIENNIKYDY